MVWRALDGRTSAAELPLSAVVVPPFDVVYDKDAAWSSKAPYAPRNVTLVKGATVALDVSQSISTLTVSSGTLQMKQNHALTVGGKLDIKAGGTIELASGTLTPAAGNIGIAGKLIVDGGSFGRSMAGVSRAISGGGLIEVKSGALTIARGSPHNVLTLNSNMRISGGDVKLSGQVYVGFNAKTTFEVVGDAAKIEISRLNAGPGHSPRTFRFVLGASGVSRINVPGWMNLGKASIVVDGSAYAGGAAKMVLIDSANLVAVVPSGNISVNGFAAKGLAAAVVQDTSNGKDWVQLVIIKAGS